MNEKSKLTPNVKALLSERWAQLTVERAGHAGGQFGKTAAVAARIAEDSGGKLKSDMREAFEWTCAAIEAVRKAASPNPWAGSTDEEIAGEILRQVRERKAK